MHRAHLEQDGFFRVFEGSFLEAPRVVQVHSTVIHCHHGMDADDTSIFVLRSELQVCPKFEVRENRETHKRVELSRKYSRPRVCSQNITILVAKV